MIRQFSPFRRSSWGPSLLVGVVLALAMVGVRHAGYFERSELIAYDWVATSGAHSSPPESRIVLIGITEHDIQAIGEWPIPDVLLAESLSRLLTYQPRAIGIDIHRGFPVGVGEEKLRSTLLRHPNMVMAMKHGGNGQVPVPPPAFLQGTEQVGFNDLLVDRDGVVRRGLLFLDDGQTVVYSLPLRLALLFLKKEGITPRPDTIHPEYLRLGLATLAPLESNTGGYANVDARGYQILLRLNAPSTMIPSYPLSALLNDQIDPEAIKDRVVLVGVTAESVPDVFHVPSSLLNTGPEPVEYGVQIHAHIVRQLLASALDGLSPIHSAGEQSEAWWILLWSTLGSACGVLSTSLWRFALFTSTGLIGLLCIVLIAFLQGWWIPLIPPGLAWVASAALVTGYMVSQEKKHRSLLMNLFSRHVSSDVAEAVWQRRHEFWHEGRPRSQELVATVLFSDLQGFSGVSEKLTPQALMEWLNRHMEMMATLVMKHGGVVDDYFGDGLKADFGVPVPRHGEAEIRRDAMNAIMCAIEVEAELRCLNETWQEQKLPESTIRIGICTGPVVAGSLGSAHRLKYTTIGDTVNIASRLESLKMDSQESAASPCRILIAESTWRYVKEEFDTVRLGEVTLKGKQEPITVFRVTGKVSSNQPGSSAPSSHKAAASASHWTAF